MRGKAHSTFTIQHSTFPSPPPVIPSVSADLGGWRAAHPSRSLATLGMTGGLPGAFNIQHSTFNIQHSRARPGGGNHAECPMPAHDSQSHLRSRLLLLLALAAPFARAADFDVRP